MKVLFHSQKLKVFHLVCLISLMRTQVVAQTVRKSFVRKTFSYLERNMCNNIMSNSKINNNNKVDNNNYNNKNKDDNKEERILKVVERSADQASQHPGDASPPAVLYLPLGGSGRPSCLPSAGSKLAQLVSCKL
jgi:hypothetical protein